MAGGDAVVAPSVMRRLIDASGRSNGEIAQRLAVGPGTVKTHVARILAKVALRDRVHIVVFAYEHGLVRPGDRRGTKAPGSPESIDRPDGTCYPAGAVRVER